jgi:folate-binding protein YgfZ
MSSETPLRSLHEARGAVFDTYQGWQLPADYGDQALEQEAVRKAVGVIDACGTGWLEVAGADRTSFLQGMLSNDLVGLEPGRGCQAAHLTPKSRVLALVHVLIAETRIVLVTRGGEPRDLCTRLSDFVIMEDVDLSDLTANRPVLSLQGPGVAELLAGITDVSVSQLRKMAASPSTLQHVEALMGRRWVWLVGVDTSGYGGIEICTSLNGVEDVWERVVEAGAVPVGQEAAKALRIEAGVLRFGDDVDETTFLPDLPIDHLVSWTKGCYVGQEPVARVHYRGKPRRRLAGLLFDPDAYDPPPKSRLVDDGVEVGHVTSVGFSDRFERPVGLGFVRREVFEPKRRLDLAPPATDDDGQTAPAADRLGWAELVALPMG